MPSNWETGHPEDDRFPDVRYYTIMEGTVIDNEDPRGLGRVRVTVPGLIEAPGSAWALPAGMGGGKAQRGHFDVPEKEAGVYVFFLGGDVDKPRYFTGHFGAPAGEADTPTDAKAAFAEDGKTAPPKVKTWETEKFAITFDDRDEKSRFFLYAKNQGQDLIGGNALMIEFDNEQGTCAISAPAGIVLRSLGIIDIDGLVINIKGRKVLDIDKPI